MFTAREQAVDLLVLAAVCREHLLLVGPPGTAKTEIIRRFTRMVDARGFHYLLTRFTEPSELFGPLDLEKFQAGTYTIRTEGMLPEAQVAFVDEVFNGSSAILNSLLTLLNERVFHNGAARQTVPLISMIGASNSVPEDPWLRAFADRFVLRLDLEPLADDLVDALLQQGWQLERDRIEVALKEDRGLEVGQEIAGLSSHDLTALHARLLEVDMAGIRPVYGQLIRELKAEGVELTDRRVVKGLKLVAGATLLRGAESAEVQDLWPIAHIWTRLEEGKVIRGVLFPKLQEAGNTSLAVSRMVSDIMLDLETLEAREAAKMTESALGAHLMELNKLRRELLNDHSTDMDSRQRVEAVIRRGLERLEGKYV
jgi:MoxR-like ATPase